MTAACLVFLTVVLLVIFCTHGTSPSDKKLAAGS
jgi:hypothetical protein